LLQKQVAEQIGFDDNTLCLWERNETEASIRLIPAIIRFLGFNPLPVPKDLADAVLVAQKPHGWNRWQAAKLIGFNESTLVRLEQGRSRRPSQETLRKLATLIGKDLQNQPPFSLRQSNGKVKIFRCDFWALDVLRESQILMSAGFISVEYPLDHGTCHSLYNL
jgi:DNA-binding XRE family transcriptional regulator